MEDVLIFYKSSGTCLKIVGPLAWSGKKTSWPFIPVCLGLQLIVVYNCYPRLIFDSATSRSHGVFIWMAICMSPYSYTKMANKWLQNVWRGWWAKTPSWCLSREVFMIVHERYMCCYLQGQGFMGNTKDMYFQSLCCF